jgi:glycosidase
MTRLFSLLALLFAALLAIPSMAEAKFTPVPWVQDATIYEVNIRQFSKEGTFRAFEPALPRLKKMGVKVLWIMPIQPIGVKERKGSLGSYYSIKDYKGINPEFGDLADFKHLVARAQSMGFKVILDWVANHAARDHPWVAAHPDWYQKNAKGEIGGYIFPGSDGTESWSDVSGLDYSKPDVRSSMVDAMEFWVRETGIDGFRCDVAGLVPIDFWIDTRMKLDRIKPLLWLAEWNDPEIHKAFDLSYHWELSNLLQDIKKGKASAETLRDLYRKGDARFAGAIRMNFTSNHDYNSWHGTDRELYGPYAEVFSVLAMTLPGVPLIYSGQEAGLDKRIAFFEKDAISWDAARLKDHSAFYRKLLQMRPRPDAPFAIIDTGNNNVFAFRRGTKAKGISVFANLSDAPQAITGQAKPLAPFGWTIVR